MACAIVLLFLLRLCARNFQPLTLYHPPAPIRPCREPLRCHCSLRLWPGSLPAALYSGASGSSAPSSRPALPQERGSTRAATLGMPSIDPFCGNALLALRRARRVQSQSIRCECCHSPSPPDHHHYHLARRPAHAAATTPQTAPKRSEGRSAPAAGRRRPHFPYRCCVRRNCRIAAATFSARHAASGPRR